MCTCLTVSAYLSNSAIVGGAMAVRCRYSRRPELKPVNWRRVMLVRGLFASRASCDPKKLRECFRKVQIGTTGPCIHTTAESQARPKV